ncbi:MAG: DUF3833 domain-containing protein [Rhodospirillaceae bacterium]|nr:DUF3833 domain-containing protein [Rhodospirillaceae bacterium]
MIRTVLLASFVILGLTGCSGAMKPEDFEGKEPRFVLEDFFEGKTKAWGMFHDRFGNIRREFEVDITGSWDGETLSLDEEFDYADGEQDRRIWTILKVDDNTYTGTADDILGVASGRTFGNALNWTYDMDLKVGDGSLRVKFDDWMFLRPGGVLLNRASVSKWGFEIGVVTLSFSRVEVESDAALLNVQQRAAE